MDEADEEDDDEEAALQAALALSMGATGGEGKDEAGGADKPLHVVLMGDRYWLRAPSPLAFEAAASFGTRFSRSAFSVFSPHPRRVSPTHTPTYPRTRAPIY